MIKRPKRLVVHNHPRATIGNHHCVLEHILIAEKALGRYLKDGEVVHHVDEDPSNNSKGNLVICNNSSYHKLLHYRTKALRECGHAEWIKCQRCSKYDKPENIRSYPNSLNHHVECMNRYRRRLYNES